MEKKQEDRRNKEEDCGMSELMGFPFGPFGKGPGMGGTIPSKDLARTGMTAYGGTAAASLAKENSVPSYHGSTLLPHPASGASNKKPTAQSGFPIGSLFGGPSIPRHPGQVALLHPVPWILPFRWSAIISPFLYRDLPWIDIGYLLEKL